MNMHEWTTGHISPFGVYGEDKPIKEAGTVIARVYNLGNDAEANRRARYMAAAPMLTKALQAIIDTPDHPMRKKCKDIARDALKELE